MEKVDLSQMVGVGRKLLAQIGENCREAEVVVELLWTDGMSDCSGGGNGATG
jgi:hypothetical protein